ncbi:MAG: P27 family phage terminase small subunit [Planctomycetota bacterium]|jgi:P27 family predicted phage terminase small subunit
MKRGPKPVSLAVKRLRGTQRGNKSDGRKKLEAEMPKMPDWLDGIAAKTWHEIAGPLFESGLIAKIDAHVLALFCDGFKDYVIIADRVEGLRTHGADEKTMIQWYKIKSRSWLAVTRLAADLHLSPASNNRFVIPPVKQETLAQKWIAKQRNKKPKR